MIPVLEAAENDGWYHLVTGDGSRFFVYYSLRRMWTRARYEVVTKPRRDIQTEKFMFAVIWNPLGFHVIDKLPTGARMNGECRPTISLRDSKKIFREERTAHAKTLIVYAGNCSIHTSGATEEYVKQNSIMRIRHSLHSADLETRDFHLFPSAKKKLKNTRMVNEDG
jgi:hypothetical protein